MNVHKTAFAVCIISILLSTFALAEDSGKSNHDFSFGLADKFGAVQSYTDGEDGTATFSRFLQMKNELPDEIPVFEPFEPKGNIEFYISTDGNDNWDGSKERPFRTFEKAFAAVSQLRDKDGGVVVYVREGIYVANNGITIPSCVSGYEGNPVIISAYPNEKVKITGGINVSGNELSQVKATDPVYGRLNAAARENIFYVDLKKLGFTEFPKVTTDGEPTMIVNGNEYHLARWPNSSTVKYANYEGEGAIDGVIDIGPVISGISSRKQTPDDGRGFEFQIIDSRPFNWVNDGNIWMFGQFDREYITSYQHVREFNKEKKSVRTYTPTLYGAQYNAHHSYYYLNVLEELDIPGEFYIDADTGILYVYPLSDVSESVLSLANTKNNLVTFENTSHDVVLNGFDISDSLGVGVSLNGIRNVVQRCNFSGIMGEGVLLEKGKNCGIINCFADGCNLRTKANFNNTDVYSDAQSLRPTRNFIQNNTVTNGQIIIRSGVQNIVSHNSVQNAEQMCIYIAECQESIVEYNEVVGGPHRILDSGCIYHEGGRSNIHNHIRYNYVHDSTIEIRQSPFAIYMDDLSSSGFVYGNIIQQGIGYAHGGSNVVFYNNIVIDNPVSKAVLTNSNNYYRGNALYLNLYKPPLGGQTAFDTSNTHKFKSSQITWKNRFPDLFEFMKGYSDNVLKNYEDGYVFTADDAEFIAPRNCVYVNNISYKANGITDDNDYETGAYKKDNWVVPDKQNIFEDYDNRNYNVIDLQSVYTHIPNFEPLPQQSKMGVASKDMRLSIKKIMPVSPANTEDTSVMFDSVEFNWTSSNTATYYEFWLAEDKDFKNIIEHVYIKNNSYKPGREFEFEKQYYWKVTAVSMSQCVDNPYYEMPAATFKICSYSDAVKRTVIDVSDIEAKISDIEKIKNSLIEDNGTDIGIGTYKVGTKAAVDEYIDSIRKQYNTLKLQKDVNALLNSIDKEFVMLLSDNAIVYTRKYTDLKAPEWVLRDKDTSYLEVSSDELKFSSLDGYNILYDNRPLTPKEIVNVNMNFGEMKQWDAYGIKQTTVATGRNVLRTSGYFAVIKTDKIELQKYPAPSSGAILQSVDNNGRILPNTFYNVESYCENLNDGIRIVFKVNGEIILDYTDTDNPDVGLGYFSKQVNKAANSGIYMRTVQ